MRYISTCFGLLRKMKHISNGILRIYVGWCCSSQSTDMFSVCAKEFSSGFLGFFHCIALEWFGWVWFDSVLPFFACLFVCSTSFSHLLCHFASFISIPTYSTYRYGGVFYLFCSHICVAGAGLGECVKKLFELCGKECGS